MAHFAKIEDGIVSEVIVAEQDFIDTLDGYWVQTSYNTYGGVHLTGGTPLRKNYAVSGYTYDSSLDAFYTQQPYPSWSLNEDTCLWEPPIAYPEDDGAMTTLYEWNEDNLAWSKLND